MIKLKFNKYILKEIQQYLIEKYDTTSKKTKQRTWKYFFRSKKFVAELYNEDKKNIIKEYKKRGYRDIKILSDRIEDINADRVELHIKVEEGKQYFHRDIEWLGNTTYPTDLLEKLLKVTPGDVYDTEFLSERLFQSKTEDDISSLYLNNGFLFFNVTPIEKKVEGDFIDIEIRIFEGEKATINRVLASGNNNTFDRVIIRELRSRPGYYFSRSDITRTFRELSQVTYLNPEEFDVSPVPNPETGTVDINYTLGERSADQIELQGGYGGNRFVGSLGLVLNNFSTRNILKKKSWRPFPEGGGQKLSLRFQTNGSSYQNYSVSFFEPWLGGKKPISLGVTVAHSRQSLDRLSASNFGATFSRGLSITSVSANIGKRLKVPDDYFSVNFGTSYEYYDLENYSNIFPFTEGYSNNLSYALGISRNSNNQAIFPTAGSTISTSLKFTLPYSLFNNKDYSGLTNSQTDEQEKYRWLEYYKLKFDLNYYINPVLKFVFASRYSFGYLGSYNSALSPVPFNRFYLGGSGLSGFSLQGQEIIALRGYEDKTLSPVQGAEVFSKFQFELRYPFVSNNYANIFGHLFFEGGNTWAQVLNFSPFDAKKSVGVGVRLFLPAVGLLGIDWGYRLDDSEFSPNLPRTQIHFIIGPQY